jgi:radical SAM protein with 4Fe4S-binding SPASM domain
MKISQFIKDTASDLTEAVTREIDFRQAKPKRGLWFLTYRCTSRCNTCTIWQRPKGNKPELSLEGWKSIVDQFAQKNISSVELFGGDVFLRKDILFGLINYMKEKRITIYLPTNCNLLDRQSAFDLVETQVDKIYLSTDGVEESHDSVRGISGTFNRVKNAISFLREARGNRSIPKLVCNTTISNLNFSILEEIVHFAKQAGFDEIHLEYAGEIDNSHIENSMIDGLRPAPYFVRQDKSILLNTQEAISLKAAIKKIKTDYRYNGQDIKTLNIDMLSLKNLVEGTVPIKKCYMERNEVTIDPYGNIVACPFVNNYILGNLLEKSIDEIWNNEAHRKFRLYQNKGKIALCKHCILSVQRNHTFSGRLRRIYSQRLLDNISKKQGFKGIVKAFLNKIKEFVFRSSYSIWFEKTLDLPLQAVTPGFPIELNFNGITETTDWIYKNTDDYYFLKQETDLALSNGHVFPNVKHNGKIIGFMKIGLNEVFIKDFRKNITFPQGTAFIYDTFVSKEYRGKKIAQAMISGAMELLKNKGVKRVLCHIEQWNTPSLCAYNTLGFKEIGKIRYLKIFGREFLSKDPSKL